MPRKSTTLLLAILAATSIMSTAVSHASGIMVDHNLAEMKTMYDRTRTNRSLQESYGRLSSGLRITGRSDDAGALSVSERLRRRIHSLEQASRNTADADSLVDTADAALDEVSAILIRMRELADQSANGTHTESEQESMLLEFQEKWDRLRKILTLRHTVRATTSMPRNTITPKTRASPTKTKDSPLQCRKVRCGFTSP